MAATPRLKVYAPDGEYVGACKYTTDAAAFAALYGPGATVRDGHRKKDIIWHEGQEETLAGDSYDEASITMNGRLVDRQDKHRARQILAGQG